MPESFTQPADLAGWLAYLEKLHPKSIAMGLERVNQVKQRLQLDPDFTIITVAGTNGKGSTCAMLESMLLAAGYRVGCYTSPHLLDYNERVRVDCVEASDEELCRAFAAVEARRGDIPLTYFEFGTLAAVWHFCHQNIQVAVLEVGLGGRLDAVNAFDTDCAIITSIDLDHMEYLGNSRESIGFEKAGVYRHNVPALCGDSVPPPTVPQHAAAIGADYRQIGQGFGFQQRTTDWDFWSESERIEQLPLPVLAGSFQLNNAACAVTALCVLHQRLPVTQQAMRLGLQAVVLAGRFQTVQESPKIILDVAHNPQAARGLAENLHQTPCSGRTLAVFAMLSDKDIGGVIAALGDEIDAWFVAGIDAPRGTSCEELAGYLSEVEIFTHPNIAQALAQACRAASENDRIVAFGSFYTVADVLRALAAPIHA
ncbi:MAG: bifunctional tetrahydrofolate synthase/dihydrofolate synthase [Methylophilales bacterium]|nr:bifunctional tetrahydrofolate synthase/dihydrofolate synthase [Methylophilales bacterium]